MSAADFKAGTYTINPVEATSDATSFTVKDATAVYGDKTPSFVITPGKDVVDPGNLTNADFIFIDKATGKTVDGVPTNVGSYDVQLNTKGQDKVATANQNYVFTADDFTPGTYKITPKATNTTDATTKVTVNNQTIKEGDPTPTFTLSIGDQLIQGSVSNADFVFMQNGQILTGVPTKAGSYTVMLSAAAQQRLAAGQNYALTSSDFIAGTFIIQAVATDPGNGNQTNPGSGSGTGNGSGNMAETGQDTVVTPNHSGQTPASTAVGTNAGQPVVANISNTTNAPTTLLDKAKKLPQTGEASGTAATTVGLALLSGLFGLLGIRRKKHEDDA
ncbi:MBG domain-containing protein [Loigolactobacillus zhaoyuanensis]|nr:MBG domain-containing protein [Loigolactobacillus zhaoyuanensis]